MTLAQHRLDFSRKNPNIMVIAHRGDWQRAPENSILSIEHAIEAGSDIVEIDIQKCLTGEFVVIHDETLDRTTNGSGLVSQTSLEEIKKLRLKERDGGESNSISNHPIPLLSELLEHAKGKILVNIDTKNPSELDSMIEEVQRFNMHEHVIVKSVYDPSQDAWNSESHGMKHMPVLVPKSGQLLADLEKLAMSKPFMIEIVSSGIEELYKAKPLLEEMDCRIWINTLDPIEPLNFSDAEAKLHPEKIWGELIDLGVSAIQTDLPKMLSQWAKTARP
jgi:glycerophosphoryl diester phosphodiesterase